MAYFMASVREREMGLVPGPWSLVPADYQVAYMPSCPMFKPPCLL